MYACSRLGRTEFGRGIVRRSLHRTGMGLARQPLVDPLGRPWTEFRYVVLVHRGRGTASDENGRLVSTIRPREQAPARTSAGAPWRTRDLLTRADLASHMKLSTRSVDRMIARHGLRSGPGRPVLVRRESYAWCLVHLRRQTTRSMGRMPALRRDAPAPHPIRPGEELLLVAGSDDCGPLVEALEMFAAGSRVRTPNECPAGHWCRSWHQAAIAMAYVRDAMARDASVPEPACNSAASAYLRQMLRKAQASSGQTLDARVLTRCLRRLPAPVRRLVLEALSGELVDSSQAGSDTPMEYLREPLLTEKEFADEMERSVATVRRWRVEGTGPIYLAIGRAVRYSRVDVADWFGQRLGP